MISKAQYRKNKTNAYACLKEQIMHFIHLTTVWNSKQSRMFPAAELTQNQWLQNTTGKFLLLPFKNNEQDCVVMSKKSFTVINNLKNILWIRIDKL